MTRTVSRLRPLGETIFAVVGEAAAAHGAVNLGRGTPAAGAPDAVAEEARAQIAAGNNQYPPARGEAGLREAICAERARRTGAGYDPGTECLVTVGATEAIMSAVLGLVEPGAEVVLIEPYYDSYRAAAAIAGARVRAVPLLHDAAAGWHLDRAALAAAVGPDTGLIIVNSPHNPTGAVLPAGDLAAVAEAARRADCPVLSDEVYERLIFDGSAHRSIAALPGMRERTLIASSAAKTFNVTGWKIGWLLGPPDLVQAALAPKQFLTCVAGAPFQAAVARGLADCDGWVRRNTAGLAANRDLLLARLEGLGIEAHGADAGYFVLADGAPLGLGDAMEVSRRLPAEAGVAVIPVPAFVEDPAHPRWRNLIRLSFAAGPEAIEAGCDRLAAHLGRR